MHVTLLFARNRCGVFRFDLIEPYSLTLDIVERNFSGRFSLLSLSLRSLPFKKRASRPSGSSSRYKYLAKFSQKGLVVIVYNFLMNTHEAE
jgi:hypothetical protein